MKKDDFLTLCQKADSLVVSGHFGQADLIYRDLIANYPKKVAGYVGLARIASKQGNHRLTLNRCDEFIQRFPNAFYLLYFKADALAALELVEKAELVFHELTEKYPDKPAGFIGLVRTAFLRHDYELALKRCGQFTPYFPNQFELLKFKAESYFALSLYEELSPLCQILIDRYPNNPASYILNARLKNALKQFEESLDLCDNIINRFPKTLAAYRIKGNALVALHRFEEAKKFFQSVILTYPTCEIGHLGIVRVDFELAQYENVLSQCDEALQLFPNEIALYDIKGKALLALSRFQEARSLYEKLSIDFPHKINGFIGLHRLFRKLEQHYPAFDAITKAYEKAPQNISVETFARIQAPERLK